MSWKFWREPVENRERILALDLLRGAFLIEIIANHIIWAPSVYILIGGGGQLPASAAEGFFAISGLLVGYLYGPRILKDTRATVLKLWKRAGLLYVLTVAFTIIFTLWGLTDPLHAKDSMTFFSFDNTVWRFLAHTFTLHYEYGWADFLGRYAVFMVFAPAAVWLVAKHRGWIVSLSSILVWYFLGSNQLLAPFPAWQVIFMNAIILGFYLPQIERAFFGLSHRVQRVIAWPVVLAFLATYVLSILYMVVIPYLSGHAPEVEQLKLQIMSHFDKDTLSLPRLLIGILWFAGLYILFRKFEHTIHKYTAGILATFGRQSLFVYGLHAFILFALGIYLWPPTGPTFVANTIVTTAVLAIIYYAAYYRRHMTDFGRRVLSKKSTTQVP